MIIYDLISILQEYERVHGSNTFVIMVDEEGNPVGDVDSVGINDYGEVFLQTENGANPYQVTNIYDPIYDPDLVNARLKTPEQLDLELGYF